MHATESCLTLEGVIQCLNYEFVIAVAAEEKVANYSYRMLAEFECQTKIG